MFNDFDAIPLREGEEILKVIRRVRWPLFFFLLVPFFLITVDFFFLFTLFHYGTPGIVVFASVLFFGILWIMRLCVKWFGSVLLLTNERMIDRSYEGLFHSSVSEISFRDVRDVAAVQRGILATLGRYGTLTIRQAGVPLQIVFSYVRAPHDVQRFMTDTVRLQEEEQRTPQTPPPSLSGDQAFERQLLELLFKRLGRDQLRSIVAEVTREEKP